METIEINDPELGEIKSEGDLSDALDAFEEAVSMEQQKPTSGLGMEGLRKFRLAIENGDKKAAEEAIAMTEDKGTKAAMQRLVKYL